MASVESKIAAVATLMRSGELNDLSQERGWLVGAFVASLDGILAWHASKMRKRAWCAVCGKLMPLKHTCEK